MTTSKQDLIHLLNKLSDDATLEQIEEVITIWKNDNKDSEYIYLYPDNKQKVTKASRQEVYEAIDSEREYQNNLGPERTDGFTNKVSDHLILMGEYYKKALTAWTNNAGDDSALEEIRKVAGICVSCMEMNGAPKRKI